MEAGVRVGAEIGMMDGSGEASAAAASRKVDGGLVREPNESFVRVGVSITVSSAAFSLAGAIGTGVALGDGAFTAISPWPCSRARDAGVAVGPGPADHSPSRLPPENFA